MACFALRLSTSKDLGNIFDLGPFSLLVVFPAPEENRYWALGNLARYRSDAGFEFGGVFVLSEIDRIVQSSWESTLRLRWWVFCRDRSLTSTEHQARRYAGLQDESETLNT